MRASAAEGASAGFARFREFRGPRGRQVVFKTEQHGVSVRFQRAMHFTNEGILQCSAALRHWRRWDFRP